jgi:hypothetical protein
MAEAIARSASAGAGRRPERSIIPAMPHMNSSVVGSYSQAVAGSIRFTANCHLLTINY